MVATASACDIVAPVGMVPVARRVDLSHELGQMAGVVDTVDLLVAARGARGDVCVGLAVRGSQGAPGSFGVGGGVGRIGGAKRERGLRKSTGAHIGTSQVVGVASGACRVRVVLVGAARVGARVRARRGGGLIPVGRMVV